MQTKRAYDDAQHEDNIRFDIENTEIRNQVTKRMHTNKPKSMLETKNEPVSAKHKEKSSVNLNEKSEKNKETL